MRKPQVYLAADVRESNITLLWLAAATENVTGADFYLKSQANLSSSSSSSSVNETPILDKCEHFGKRKNFLFVVMVVVVVLLQKRLQVKRRRTTATRDGSFFPSPSSRQVKIDS